MPLPLTEWLNSPAHMDLEDEPLSKVQYGVLRHAEQIYFPDLYVDLARENLKWRMVRYVNTLWMMVGKGGGKDRIAARIYPYGGEFHMKSTPNLRGKRVYAEVLAYHLPSRPVECLAARSRAVTAP